MLGPVAIAAASKAGSIKNRLYKFTIFSLVRDRPSFVGLSGFGEVSVAGERQVLRLIEAEVAKCVSYHSSEVILITR